MLKRTALFDAHSRLGARLVEFGGWEMPIQYTGILDEHHTVRKAAGVFDISHMGEAFVSGPAAEAFLNATLTNDTRKLAPGQGQYTLLCNPQGGVIDDLFAYRLAPESFLLIINASRAATDVAWLREQLATFPQRDGVTFDDASDRLSAIALQGPTTPAFVDLLLPPDLLAATPATARPSALKRNRLAAYPVGTHTVWFARTGYTGEDGFEIVAPNALIAEFWNRALTAGAAHGIKPCGLGARDTLRTEMCFPLYGQELTEQTTPLEAGLDVFVALDKPAFTGQAALLAQKQAGIPRRLVALRMVERSAPPVRPHYPVLDASPAASRLGETTSGTLSPSLGVGIALAYVPPSAAEPGTRLVIEVRGRPFPAEVVKKPLYRRPAPVNPV